MLPFSFFFFKISHLTYVLFFSFSKSLHSKDFFGFFFLAIGESFYFAAVCRDKLPRSVLKGGMAAHCSGKRDFLSKLMSMTYLQRADPRSLLSLRCGRNAGSLTEEMDNIGSHNIGCHAYEAYGVCHIVCADSHLC